MQTYEGIYSYGSADNRQKAGITVTHTRLEIHLKDEHGNPRVVYWRWHNITKGRNNEWYHSGQPLQMIVVQNDAFNTVAMKQLGKRRWSPVPVFLIGFVALVIVILVALYFWLIPMMATYAAGKMPVDYEVKMGDKAYDAMIGDFKVDEPQTKRVNDFFKAMQVPSKYPVRITVVDLNETNAFAVPGGRIVVFNGLLKEMQHPEELAALLAHEFSHVELRHTTRSLLRSLGTYMVASLVIGDLSGIGAVVVENAHSLRTLEYSRQLEKEADLNGLKLLEARHINGDGYIWLFKTLGKGGGAVPSEWLSSHPDLQNRIRYVQEHHNKASDAPVSPGLETIWKQIKGDGKDW